MARIIPPASTPTQLALVQMRGDGNGSFTEGVRGGESVWIRTESFLILFFS
jgi:hypothetical protein